MNRLNFNSLSHYKAPDEWIKTAAAIPETAVKRRAAFPIYRFAAAASVVLVSVIGLLVFLLHQSPDSVLIAPRNSAATQPETDGTAAVGDIAETVMIPAAGDGDILPTAGQEYPTTADSQPITEVAVPTSSATTPQGTAPTAVPSQQPTSRLPAPTEAQSPTTVRPTAPPAPTTAPTNPPKPTAPPATQEPTEPYTPPKDRRIYAVVTFFPDVGEIIDDPLGEGDAAVFCCLYDASGNIVGSKYYNDWEKAAEVLSVNEDDSYIVMYDPVEKGLPIKSGRYEYVFYDKHGEELYRGTVEY